MADIYEFGKRIKHEIKVIIQKSHGEQLRFELVFGQLEMFLLASFLNNCSVRTKK